VIIHKINRKDYLIVAGDLNARVGNAQIDGVLGINSEMTLNKNGQNLIEFASWNALKTTNAFFFFLPQRNSQGNLECPWQQIYY
jgi:hypothetical protein